MNQPLGLAGWVGEAGRRARRQPERAVNVVLGSIALAVGLRGLWFYVQAMRVRLPEPGVIGWLEPLFMRSALEAASGRSLYPAPSAQYIGGLYTPGADYLHGAVIGIFGPHYAALRFVAWFFFVGAMGLCSWWVYRATRKVGWSILCAILIVSLSGGLNLYFSRINVDAHYLAFAVAAMMAVYLQPSRRRNVVTGAVLLAAAFLCKPQAIFWALSVLVALLLVDRRRALDFALVCAGIAGSVSLALVIATDGWFWRSVVVAGMQTPTLDDPRYAGSLWAFSWLASASLLVFIPPYAFAAWRTRKPQLILLACWAPLVVVQSYTSFAREGGGPKHLHVALLAGTILFAMSPMLWRELRIPARFRRLLLVPCFALIAVNLWGAFDNHGRVAWRVQNRGSVEAARAALFRHFRTFDREVDEAVGRFAGPVFVGGRVLPLLRRGKPLTAHQSPFYTYTVRSSVSSYADSLGPSFAAQEYEALILWKWGRSPNRQLWADLPGRYVLERELGADPTIGLRVSVWRRHRPSAP